MYLILFSVLFTSVCLVSPCPGGCVCSVSLQVSCISSGNPLTRIPEFLAGTLSLTVGNQNIERIYKEDFAGENVSGLEVADLARNNIRMVDDGAFEELGDLTNLYLNENLITAINESTFSNLRKLQDLVLSRNNIEVIADGAFKELKTLNRLDLSGNSISVVNEFTFCGLQHMEYLFLMRNNIESIDAAAFNDLRSLINLFLSKNNLTVIPDGALSEQRNLTILLLTANSLLCDCEMQWLVDFIADSGVRVIGTCHSPDMMKGTSLGDLSDEDFASCQFTTADTPSIRSTSTGGGLSTAPNPPSSVFPMKPSPSVPLKQSSLPAVTVDTSRGDSSHRGGYHVVLITSFLSGGALIVIVVVFCLFLKGIRGRHRQRGNSSTARGGSMQMSDDLNHASGTDN